MFGSRAWIAAKMVHGRSFAHLGPTCCSINTPNGGGVLLTVRQRPWIGGRRGTPPAHGTGHGPGSKMVERVGVGCGHVRSDRRLDAPESALGDVPALTGGGGSRLARVSRVPTRAGP